MFPPIDTSEVSVPAGALRKDVAEGKDQVHNPRVCRQTGTMLACFMYGQTGSNNTKVGRSLLRQGAGTGSASRLSDMEFRIHDIAQ